MISHSTGSSVKEFCDAIEVAVTRFVGMLRQVKDPTLPAIGTWSVGVTAAHLASSSLFFLSVAQGKSKPTNIDTDHTGTIVTEQEWDLDALAEQLITNENALLKYARELYGDPEIELFEGLKVPFSTLLAVELNEVLIHGYDIARASGLPWQISKNEAAITLGGTFPLWPSLVNRQAAAGLKARFELRLRGGGRVVLAFDDARMQLEEPYKNPVDCYLSFDPVTLLLLSFNRIQPWGPMLQGKIAAWGRRFWLAGKFPTLFKSV